MMAFKRTVAFLLSFFTLLISFSAVVSAHVNADANDSDHSSLSFRDKNGAFGISLSPSELLSLLVGGTVTEAEAEYLDRYSQFHASYSTPWNPADITITKNGEKLSVSAECYSYTAENGTVVTWIPKKAAAHSSEAEFSDTLPYLCELDHTSAETVTVYYYCAITLDSGVADKLLNFAYTNALEAKSLDGANGYATALAAWRDYTEAMEKFRDEQVRYASYEKALADYESQKKNYESYVSEQAEYIKKLAEYEKYITDYNAYLKATADYERAYLESTESSKKYVAYLNNLNSIRTAMHAMESLYTKPTSGKTGNLHKALQNPELIVMFERYRSTLVSAYGVKDSDITEMRAVSDELTVILNEYAAAREVSEAAAFSYYREHYGEICEKFNFLYERMRGVMTKRIFNHICAKIELEYGTGDMGIYKKWRVKNVLAHIYLICLCLDDTRTAEGIWEFYTDAGDEHTYYFSDLLDQNLILPDTNASDPSPLTWIDEPERIPLPDFPEQPKPISEPLAPAEVSNPQKPAEVTKPIEPEYVEEPSAPSAEVLSAIRKTERIVAELNNGNLSKRSVTDYTHKITLTHEITKAIPSATPTVSLYDHNGTYLEESNTASPAPLSSFQDDAYEYEFKCWAPSPYGASASRALPECLWAIYEKTPRKYTVTININGNQTQANASYGELPTLPQEAKRTSTATTDYTFAGWDPEPYPVISDQTYTAQYIETERLYEVVFDTADGKIVRNLPYGKTPDAPVIRSIYFDACKRYEFSSWSENISPVTQNITYTAKYNSTLLVSSEGPLPTLDASFDSYTLTGNESTYGISELLKLAGNENKKVSLVFGELTATLDTKAVKNLYSRGAQTAALLTDTAGGMGIFFGNRNGSSVSLKEGELRMSLDSNADKGGVASVVAYYANGTHRAVASNEADGKVGFIASPNATYRLSRNFSLVTKATEGGKVILNTQIYASGAPINATLYPDNEYVVSSIKLINNASGEETPLENLFGLKMPSYDATLYVEFSQKKYTVTFIANGKVISAEQYLLGDTVNVPQAPSDYEENGYRYTFIGWTRPIVAVTSDAEYTAKYFAVPIPANKKEQNAPSDGSAWAMGTVIVDLIIPVCVLFVVLAAGGTTVTVLLLKNRKIKKNKNKK